MFINEDRFYPAARIVGNIYLRRYEVLDKQRRVRDSSDDYDELQQRYARLLVVRNTHRWNAYKPAK